MSEADESALCVSCGLCCNGTLFDRARTTVAEAPALPQLGLTVRADGERLAFVLPCPRLDGACCTIYDRRPQRCHSYACALLEKVRVGAEPAATHRHVADAHAALAQVRAVAPEATLVADRVARLHAASAWSTTADPGVRKREAKVYLAILALERILDAHFRKPHQAILAGDRTQAPYRSPGSAGNGDAQEFS